MTKAGFRTSNSKATSDSSPTRSRTGSKPVTTRSTRTELAAAALVLLALAAGCTDSPSTGAPPEASATTTSATDDGDRAGAERAARRVLQAWARPQLPYAEWWADLEPLLRPEAREEYSYTDPAVVPALKIAGPGNEDSEPYDPYVTAFYFETNEGRFGVDVARDSIGGPWLAYSIIFPDGVSQRQ